MPSGGPATEAPDYRYFDLACSHHELGYELGSVDPPYRAQSWWAPPPDAAYADECARVVMEIHPPLMDELGGYAEAQRQNAQTVWRACCRVNLKARIRASSGAIVDGPGEGCSTFWWRGANYTITGRNYDYSRSQARRQRIRFRPAGQAGIASIGARGSVPCGRYDGVNARGLWISLHVVMTDTPGTGETPPGVPFHLVGRLALELCGSAREARDLLLRIPHLSSLCYLVADANEAFVIEADPRRVRALDPALAGDEGSVSVTNHYRHPEMRPLQALRALEHSQRRCAYLQRGPGPDASWPEAQAAALASLSDHNIPVCGRAGWMETLWSAVADLRNGRIWYAAGPPDVTHFEAIPPITSGIR